MKSARSPKVSTPVKTFLTAITLSIAGLSHQSTAQTFTNDGTTATFTDNFNRANVPYSSAGTGIGTGYVAAATNGGSGAVQFGIMNNTLAYNGDGTSTALLQQNLTLGANYSITDAFTANIQYPTVSGRLIFGYQDANNYYEFQLADDASSTNPGFAALFRVSGGNATVVAQGNTSTAVVQGSSFTLSVGAAPGFATGSQSFALSVYAGMGTSGKSIFSQTYTDNAAFLGGYAGLNGTSYYPVSQFSITSDVPEPSIYALLGLGVAVVAFIGRRQTASTM